jgi:hypothetical protein
MTDTPNQNTCIAHACLKPNAKHCTRCRIATYCSADCQRSDYKNHRPFCMYVAKTREMHPDRPLCHDSCFLVLMYSVQSVALAMYNTRAARRADFERLSTVLNTVDEKAHDAVKQEAVRALATYEEHGNAIGEEVTRQASRILTLVRVFYEHSPHARDTPLDQLNAMFVAATRELDEHVHVMLVASVPPSTTVLPPTMFGQPRPFACSAILTASTRTFSERLKKIPGMDGLDIKDALALNQDRLRNQTGFLAVPTRPARAIEAAPTASTRHVRFDEDGKRIAIDANPLPLPPPPPTTPPPAYTEPDGPSIPSTRELHLPPPFEDAKSMISTPVLRNHAGPVIGRVVDAATDADGKTTVVIEPPLV